MNKLRINSDKFTTLLRIRYDIKHRVGKYIRIYEVKEIKIGRNGVSLNSLFVTWTHFSRDLNKFCYFNNTFRVISF